MTQPDLMEALRDSYHEVLSRKRRIPFHGRSDGVASLRRYLRYFMDLLDIYLDIQRDRRWRNDDW